MAKKQTEILTFHQVRERCERGDADAWRTFLGLYGPVSLHLLRNYSVIDSNLWEQTLAGLVQNNFEALRAMARQTEREFLIDLRSSLLDHAMTETAARPPAAAPRPDGASVLDLERAGKLVEGLPLLHQEIVWYRLSGYTNSTIERILRMAPHVANAALDRLLPDFAAARDVTEDRCLWPAEWLAVLHQARAEKKDQCPALHQMLRIHDGQVTWYDKEPVEQKVAGCLHCLETWTGLREVGFWRRAAPAVTAQQIEKWLALIPVAAVEKKSFFGRVFK